MNRAMTWMLAALAALLMLPLIGAALIAFALPRYDLGAMATARAAAALGRAVTIESVRVSPGRVTTVTLRNATVANIEGGSAPAMATLEVLHARLDLLPLLRGEVVLREARIEGLSLLLERTADRRRNWRFKGDPAGPSVPFAPEPPDRSGLPLILGLTLARSEIVFRTSAGRSLRTRLDSADLAAPAPDQPLALRIAGAYNGIPMALAGTLGSPEQLRDGRAPFPMTLRAESGETYLAFTGTSRDPMNFDRLGGSLEANAPALTTILALAGADTAMPLPLRLAGPFARNGDVWRLAGAEGALGEEGFAAPLLELTEGTEGAPDAVVAEVDFVGLDLNRLFDAAGGTGEADLPLIAFAAPDPLVRARLSARTFAYARVRGTDARLAGEVVPGRVSVEAFSLAAFGGRVEGSATIESRGRLAAEARLENGDVDALRRVFGMRALPVTGRATVRAVASAEGQKLNEAIERARVSAVLAMRGGSVTREVIELASTNIQALFRTASGTTPLRCLLAVVDMRAGRGEVAPLRLRAAEGTISGIATFDLDRERLDLVIGSQRETTGFFALDIPVRVSGSFDDPGIEPASWSSEGRARLAAGDRVAPLPPALRDFARASPCYRAG